MRTARPWHEHGRDAHDVSLRRALVIETFLADESDELVTPATQAGATVRMIEDRELLRAHGGVAAALRFRS